MLVLPSTKELLWELFRSLLKALFWSPIQFLVQGCRRILERFRRKE